MLFGNLLKMAKFDMLDDEDIFFTQTSKNDVCVSLEEDMEYKTIHDPNYSDISDAESEKRDDHKR